MKTNPNTLRTKKTIQNQMNDDFGQGRRGAKTEKVRCCSPTELKQLRPRNPLHSIISNPCEKEGVAKHPEISQEDPNAMLGR